MIESGVTLPLVGSGAQGISVLGCCISNVRVLSGSSKCRPGEMCSKLQRCKVHVLCVVEYVNNFQELLESYHLVYTSSVQCLLASCGVCMTTLLSN